MGPKGRASNRRGVRIVKVPTYVAPYRGGQAIRRLGSSSMANALARVHTFKRVGEPVVISNLVTGRAGTFGNNDVLNIAATTDQFVPGTTQVAGAFRFALAQASNVTEITNLFDNYRIVRVKLMLSLSANNGDLVGAASTLPIPMIHYTYDPDDGTVPASRTGVLENGYCRSRRLDKPFSITVTPRAQQSVVGGVGSAGGLLPTSTWLDCASPAIYHYGVKFWMDQFPYTSTDKQFALTITPVYYLEAKNVV